MDVADIAQREYDHELATILANRPKPSDQPSATECDECLVPIPEQRRLAVPGCRLCIDCKTLVEIKGRR